MEKTYSYERKIELAVLFHYGRLEAVNKVLPVITAFFMYSASRIFKREQAENAADNNKSAYGKEKYGISADCVYHTSEGDYNYHRNNRQYGKHALGSSSVFGVVMSVIHALKAESLLVEPKNVITQSITITVTAVAVITL